MDDILQRMLEVDRQGEQFVKDAEAKAVAIREESAKLIAKKNAEFSAETARRCADEIAKAVQTAQAERATQLAEAQKELSSRCQAFKKEIESHRGELLSMLTGMTK